MNCGGDGSSGVSDIDTISLCLDGNAMKLIIRRQNGQVELPITIKLVCDQELVFYQPKDFYVLDRSTQATSTVTEKSQCCSVPFEHSVVKEEPQECDGSEFTLGDLLRQDNELFFNRAEIQSEMGDDSTVNVADHAHASSTQPCQSGCAIGATVLALQCDQCEKVFTTRAKLLLHKRLHVGVRPFPCDFPGCDYSASRLPHLNEHIRIHTGSKPYLCDFLNCDYSATQVGNLQIHKRKHTEERPFACDFLGCPFSAAHASNLKKHRALHAREGYFYGRGRISSSSKNTGRTRHCCDFANCEYISYRSSDMDRHKRRHTGEKPYICNFSGCHYSASDSGTLYQHERRHSDPDTRPYECDFPSCYYRSANNSHLSAHKVRRLQHAP